MSDEEDVTAQLLRLAQGPPDPSAGTTGWVGAIVLREWRLARRRRLIRRRAAILLTGIAASVLIVMVANRSRPVEERRGQVIAITRRIQGKPVLISAGQRAGSPLSVSTPVAIHDVVATDDASRAAVDTADGSSVRLDRGSRVRFDASTTIEVLAGAAYISTAAGSHGFEVRTTIGELRDLGTQFEVRLLDSSLRVRVRAGAVEIRRNVGVTTAAAGTEATVTATGMTTRPLPAYGSEWSWTTDIGPSLPIEGRTLRVFLDHLASEEGWTLRYADRAAASAADRTILHGSVDGLTAKDALGVVLPTTGFRYRLNGGELLVSREADAR